MRYQNIIFDFGNVLGTFNFSTLMKACCGEEKPHLQDIIFYDWDRLDAGLIDYDTYFQSCLKQAHPNDFEAIELFFQNWYKLLPPIEEIHNWIKTLKKQGVHLYLCSNAPVIFEKNVHFYPILHEFEGTVFSGSLQLTKPQPEIYLHLLQKYQLKAETCFFIDDKEMNVEAAKQCGIDGMVYQNNLQEIMVYLQEKG